MFGPDDHWNDLISELGARPSPADKPARSTEPAAEAHSGHAPDEAHQETGEPAPPAAVAKPTAQTSAPPPAAAPAPEPAGDWDNLLADLGLPVPVETKRPSLPEKRTPPQPPRSKPIAPAASEPSFGAGLTDLESPVPAPFDPDQLGPVSADFADALDDVEAELDDANHADQGGAEHDEGESASVDRAGAPREAGEEDQRGRRRRRRRGRRRNEGGHTGDAGDEGDTAQQSGFTDEVHYGNESDDREAGFAGELGFGEGLLDEDEPILAEEVPETTDRADERGEADQESRKRRRRRRGRGGRSRRGAESAETAEPDAVADESIEAEVEDASGFGAGLLDQPRPPRPAPQPRAPRERVQARHEEASDDADDLGDDAGDEEGGDLRPSHRGIPTWDEAIGAIVGANIEARNKRRESGGGGGGGDRHRRGGRGRRDDRGRRDS
jgi:hypothetical protein